MLFNTVIFASLDLLYKYYGVLTSNKNSSIIYIDKMALYIYKIWYVDTDTIRRCNFNLHSSNILPGKSFHRV